MPREIGLNTLAYMHRNADNKVEQKELLKEIKEMGFPIVEVRREYILSGKTEMKEIAALASSSGLKVYYSVPAELFEAGALNDQLSSYFEEASLLRGPVEIDVRGISRIHSPVGGRITGVVEGLCHSFDDRK